MKICATWVNLANGDYPRLWVRWSLDDDGLGYTGVAQAWKDGNTKDGGEHTIWVRLGTPLGYGLHLSFDPHQIGAWSFCTVKSCNELSPSVLDLVNAWAAECWKHLRRSRDDI